MDSGGPQLLEAASTAPRTRWILRGLAGSLSGEISSVSSTRSVLQEVGRSLTNGGGEGIQSLQLGKEGEDDELVSS